MSLITAANAAQLALAMTARCGYITRAVWANGGQALVVSHGSGLSIWLGGFDARPNHVFAAEAPMRAVAASSLGPLAATAGHDGQIRLWNTETWTRDQQMPVQLHRGAATAVGFHPSRWVIASGDANGFAVQVDLKSGRFMKLLGHSKDITRIAYSPDGKQIATGSWDRTARLFNATTGIHQHTLEHSAWVRWLAYSRDGAQVATACSDGVLRLWNSADGTLAHEVEAHPSGLDALDWSPDGSLLATGGRDGALRLWDASTLALLGVRENAHTKPVLTLAFRPQGDFLISGGGDNWLHLWEIPAEDPPAQGDSSQD